MTLCVAAPQARFCEASFNNIHMIACPVCKSDLPETARTCPRCRADVSLLTSFVTDVRQLLDRADAHRRAGDLAPAVEAYLDVLQVDPLNAEARAVLGPVLRALHATVRWTRPSGDVLSLKPIIMTLLGAAAAMLLGYGLVRLLI